LWNIPQLTAVQWNASAPNKPAVGGVALGALGRNAGEVIGVFGDLQIEPYFKALFRPGYMSSINMANLEQLEQLVGRLKPPAWPSVFPAIDETKRWRDSGCSRTIVQDVTLISIATILRRRSRSTRRG
jgi:hypothetical protein